MRATQYRRRGPWIKTDARDVIVFIALEQPKLKLERTKKRLHSLPHNLLPKTWLAAIITRSLVASSLSRGFDEELNAPASIL